MAGSRKNEPMSTSVTHSSAEHRYIIELDGAPVGFTEYVQAGSRRTFVHTEIDPAHEGQGLASELVEQALTQVRADGLRIAATCPYVVRWLSRHHQFDDIVDRPTQRS